MVKPLVVGVPVKAGLLVSATLPEPLTLYDDPHELPLDSGIPAAG